MIFSAMNEESMDDIQEIGTLRRVIHLHLAIASCATTESYGSLRAVVLS
jgi:hypothetical protein